MEKDRPGHIYRLLLIVINLLFILFSIAIIAAGVWFFIERNYMSSVMQSDLFSVASVLLFVSGVIIFIVSFFGCFGAYRGITWMLYVYLAVNLFMVLITLCAAFIAAAFNEEIKGILKNNMDDTLVKRYGNNTHNTTINRIVTQAWDRMQIRLNCCAVDTEGWGLYQQSSWYLYKKHNNYEISEINLVPESCCRRATYDWDLIINPRICQTTQGGPPATAVGSPNKYLNYVGCYDAAKSALGKVIWVIFGFGFVLAILIIVGMVSAICLARAIRRARKEVPSGRPQRPQRPQRVQRHQDY